MNQYDKWDDSLYTPIIVNDIGNSSTFISLNKNASADKSIKSDL